MNFVSLHGVVHPPIPSGGRHHGDLDGIELHDCRRSLHQTGHNFRKRGGHFFRNRQRVIPKAHVARMRICMPATTDYWVNDADAEPLFVLTAEANDGLAKMFPAILAEVRTLVGERRVTIVFDRGGWSPKLFQKILAEGFDILTYRKAWFRKLPKRCFKLRRAAFDGRKVTYWLADQSIRLLRGKLRLRQVTRLSENGHQTPIVTSRRDIRDVEVAFRMFEPYIPHIVGGGSRGGRIRPPARRYAWPA
jgi:hypothetical protein